MTTLLHKTPALPLKQSLIRQISAPLKSALRPVRRHLAAQRMMRQWGALQQRPDASAAPRPARRILIAPGDPYGIAGSLGDDAMIRVVIAQYASGCPGVQVAILCGAGAPEATVRGLGHTPVVLPRAWNFAIDMAAILDTGDFDALVVIRADVMDGYYNPDYSAQLLVTADLAARAGLQSAVLGFSFDAEPAPELVRYFTHLHPDVTLNLRDLTSCDRIAAFAPCAPRLVADSAFLLPAGQIDAGTDGWLAAQRAAARKIIGINLHPLLLRQAGAVENGRMLDRMAAAIVAADSAATGRLAWCLVPHDYRDTTGDGDRLCLQPLMDRLAAYPQVQARLFDGQHPAPVLKALAGRLDGVVTGRMHLAIAALGMGVPVLCLTYQGKFEGLFRHFDLPRDYLLPPDALLQNSVFAKALAQFLQDLPALTQTVATHRPQVMALAQRNFAAQGHAA